MRHYVPTTYERGRARTDPGWVALLVVPTLFATGVATWAAVATTPAAVFGVVAGLLVGRAVRRGYPLARRAVTTMYRLLDPLVTDHRVRRHAGEV
ncbi:hypothetical protein [Halorarius halobius]|uniref:hypothetical protein n=1 Tax=Halorarius halobius TaxID=2962671 RepID=UPI0020CD0311|nr:hypothetical protein [Halorarius halobius]